MRKFVERLYQEGVGMAVASDSSRAASAGTVPAARRAAEVRRPDILIMPRAPPRPDPGRVAAAAVEAAHNSRLVHRCW